MQTSIRPITPVPTAGTASRSRSLDAQLKNLGKFLLVAFALLCGVMPAIGLSALLPLEYALAAGAVTVLAGLAFARGWNLRCRDPNLTEPLMVVALLLQLGVAVAAPL